MALLVQKMLGNFFSSKSVLSYFKTKKKKKREKSSDGFSARGGGGGVRPYWPGKKPLFLRLPLGMYRISSIAVYLAFFKYVILPNIRPTQNTRQVILYLAKYPVSGMILFKYSALLDLVLF